MQRKAGWADCGILIMVLAVFLALVFSGVWACREPVRRKKLRQAAVLYLAFGMGAVRMYSVSAAMEARTAGIMDGQEVSVQGRIVKKQRKEIQNQTAVYGNMQDQEIQWNVCLADSYLKTSQEVRFGGNVTVYMNLNRNLNDEPVIGNTILISGNVKLFSEARNDGNFDERAYNQNQGYSLKIYADDHSYQIVDMHTDKIRECLYHVQQKLFQVYEQNMPKQEAGALSAMLLGEKALLSGELKELYRQSGIAHILAISGLHISILGAAFFRMLRKKGVSYNVSALVSMGMLVLFGMMAGMGISTMRAVVMFGVYLGAVCCGRSYDSVNALAAAAACVLLQNPRVMFLAGCQFSFAAVAGVLFGKEICRIFRPRFRFSETVIISFGIQMMTLPLTAWYYYEIPVYSVLLNLLVLPFMELVLLMGLLGGSLGLAASALAGKGIFVMSCQITGTVSRWLLSVCTFVLGSFEEASGLFLKLPGAVYLTGKPQVWQMAGYFLVLSGCVYAFAKTKREQDRMERKAVEMQKMMKTQKVMEMQKMVKTQKVVKIQKIMGMQKMITVLGCAGCLIFLFVPLPKQPEAVFLDVGQGDGIYIHTSDGLNVFIDGGSNDVKEAGTYRILPFLKSQGVAGIDYWFVSHLDQDHISGLEEIAESGYPIGQVVLAEGVLRDEAYEKMTVRLSECRIPVQYMGKGDVLRGEAAAFRCLAPDGRQTGGDDRNAESLVLLYEDCGFCSFFSGDISAKEEIQLCMEETFRETVTDADITLYKAAHHGSKHSNSEELLGLLKPAVSVVSCGKENDYGHPGREAVLHMQEHSREVCYTMDSGQIRIVWNKDSLQIRKYVSESQRI